MQAGIHAWSTPNQNQEKELQTSSLSTAKDVFRWRVEHARVASPRDIF
jgi:hypothetical protein